MRYNPVQDRYEAVYKNFRQPGEWKIKYQVQGNQGFWSDTVTGIVQAAGVSTPVTIQISFNQPPPRFLSNNKLALQPKPSRCQTNLSKRTKPKWRTKLLNTPV